MNKQHSGKIICPVGSWMQLEQAIINKVTAIYVGLYRASARPDKYSFTVENIIKIRELTRNKAELYVAINNPIEQSVQAYVLESIEKLAKININAFIISDLGLIYEIINKKKSTLIHLSCLAGIWNSLAVRTAISHGVSRIIFSPNLSKDEIISMRKNNPDIDFEIIASGGICLFDCYRCSLPHEIIRGNYTTTCSKSIIIQDSCNSKSMIKKPQEIGFKIKWCLENQIEYFKIEGRSRSAESIKNQINKVKLTQYNKLNNNLNEGDPYSMLSRMHIIETKKGLLKLDKFPEKELLYKLKTLLNVGAINKSTNFWYLPLSSDVEMEFIPGWDGLIINDLAGPPFRIIDNSWEKLQWLSPLYVFDSNSEFIIKKMEELLQNIRLQAFRIHDIGLLNYAHQLINGSSVELIWDRFGWPGRARIPLSLTENFLIEQGVKIFEYGEDQKIVFSANIKVPYMILVLPGNLAALIPPNVQISIENGALLRFANSKSIYKVYDGLLIEKNKSHYERNKFSNYSPAKDITIGISSLKEATFVTNFIKHLKAD